MASSDIRAIIRQLENKRLNPGWRVQQTKSSHYVALGPNGQRVSMPSTPSDHRSVKNVKAKLRRAGARVT